MRDVICGHQRPSAAIRGTHTHLLQLCLPTTYPTTNGSAPRQAHRVADVLIEAHDTLVLTRVLRQVPAHLWGVDDAVMSNCMQAVPRYPCTLPR